MARPARRPTEKRPNGDQGAQRPSPRVEVQATAHGTRLIVDGIPRRHGVFDDGMLFLHDYAYDPAGDLEELGARFVAYREHVESMRRQRAEGGQA